MGLALWGLNADYYNKIFVEFSGWYHYMSAIGLTMRLMFFLECLKEFQNLE